MRCHSWLQWFFELCTYADLVLTSVIRCNLNFSDLEMAGARWPCEDVGTRFLAACNAENIFVEWRPLPSDVITAWLPSTAILDPHGVLGILGDLVPRQAGQGHSDRDSIRPSESLCETNGGFIQQCSTSAGAAEAHVRGTQQRVMVPVVADVLDGGAVGPQDELYQGGGLRALPSAGWHDSGSRAGIWNGVSGAIPSQGIP